MNRVSLRKSLKKQGFGATMSGFWGPEGDWGIRRVAYVGWAICFGDSAREPAFFTSFLPEFLSAG